MKFHKEIIRPGAPKIGIASAIVLVLVIFVTGNLLRGEAAIPDSTGERIQYRMRPCGIAEYKDLGTVDLKGTKVNLVTFRTKAFLFEDTQNIYSDPESFLPIRIEHVVTKAWLKEQVTQDYDQKNFTVVIKKTSEARLVNEQTVKANGPIQDAILLPFYLSRLDGLKIGWHTTVRIPDEYTLELVSRDKITVPAGTFQAYHFKSTPDKFEIWTNENTPRVPLRIEVKDVISYALLMEKFSHEAKP